MSIREFFDKLIDREILPECDINIDPFEIIESIELSQSIGATAIQASFNCKIIEITKTFGVNIHYHLKFNNPTTSHSVSLPNALEILMRNSYKKQIYIPSSLKSTRLNRKNILYNDIIECIHKHGGGWSTVESADTQGKYFVNCLHEAVWYIDMCGHLKFKE
ncbi:3788_t:CDS:1, partial [Racocetra persica]